MDNGSNKCTRKEKLRPPKIVNESQPLVGLHQMDIEHPQSSSQMCYINEVGTLENSNILVLGNHEASNGIQEFFINYTSSGEMYDQILRLSTNASQLSLLKESLPIQIQRPS
jgi:hypothetical protein